MSVSRRRIKIWSFSAVLCSTRGVIFEDKVSGTRTERLGCSVKHLVDIVDQLHQQNTQFKSLTDVIDTGTPSGRFFLHVMDSLAEMEYDLTMERTQVGLAVAR